MRFFHTRLSRTRFNGVRRFPEGINKCEFSARRVFTSARQIPRRLQLSQCRAKRLLAIREQRKQPRQAVVPVIGQSESRRQQAASAKRKPLIPEGHIRNRRKVPAFFNANDRHSVPP